MPSLTDGGGNMREINYMGSAGIPVQRIEAGNQEGVTWKHD